MKIFSDKIPIFFSALLLIIIMPHLNANSLFDTVIPKPSRCWFVNSDGDQLAYTITKELSHAILIWSEYELLMRDNTPKCDGYIFIRQNLTKFLIQSESDLMTINEKCEVSTRIILIYQAEVDVDFARFGIFRNTTLNILLLRISELKNGNYENQKVQAIAPLSGHKITFNGNNLHSLGTIVGNTSLTDLFETQVWNPLKQNATLKVVMTEYRPFNFKNKNGQYDGFEYRILSGIMKNISVNFLQQLYNVKRPATLIALEMLDANEVDVGLCSRCLLDVPKTSLSVVLIYESACRTLLVPKPSPVDPVTYLYLSLSTHTWLSFIATFIITCIVIYSFANIKDRQSYDNYAKTPYLKITYCFISLLGVVAGHGTFFPQITILKLTLLLWMLACMLVTTSFSTGYSSFLAEQKFTSRITTTDQVTDAGITWIESSIPMANNMTKELFESSFRPSLRIFAERFEPYPEEGWNEVARRIRSGGRAMISRIMNQKYLLDTLLVNKTDFTDVLEPMEDCFENCMFTLAVSPRTPFRYILKSRLSAAVESGLTRHWIDEVMRKDKFSLFDKKKSKHNPEPLTVANIRGSFLFLLIGCALATCYFIFELIYGQQEIKGKNELD